MSNLVKLAAKDCYVSEEWIKSVIDSGPNNVKIIHIKKKGDPNKTRIIHRPSAELETLQRWLTLTIFNQLANHEIAMAFLRGKSILSNAERHRKSKYFIRVDFKDFFKSIKADDLFKTIKFYNKSNSLISLSESDQFFIKRVCFDKLGRLPIGYISSPAISNAVMYDFDTRLLSLVNDNKAKLGAGIITRYADDIVFSTDTKGGCLEFLNLFKIMVNKNLSPRIFINEKKTIFSSRAGGSAIVTGLRVCQDSHITITRDYKDKIRLMLSLFEKGKLMQEDTATLRGHLSYIEHVAPAFFSKICAKYLYGISKILDPTPSPQQNN
ncbi:retron St85 family RNA-directed DNA polymerase [Pseudomonas sp. N040]|uniref:retron St85 family RNA-directed DNA polymerase n=1 Tax=Pseudomonas sp. N040 TaxID=2785325 RepID=UPI0018A3069F|nr:retron St85 family RNA-directed DNA polymerase [Pseudomonas sp. N040]MBF7731107.1 RNA-directed DNA polymerase [Pseudomonas sp. N040]MBW7014750.1 retron St85 family RNA-directed DNA polymerase [Pseudomonas sp. N040]